MKKFRRKKYHIYHQVIAGSGRPGPAAESRMKLPVLVVLWCLALAPGVLAAAEAISVGNLLLLGGSAAPREFWPKFLELAGGPDSPIVVLPTASERPEAGPEYVEELRQKYGAGRTRWLPIYSQADARNEDFIAALREAKGIFLTGGDQRRITRAFLGTPALDAIRAAFNAGAVLGGTSAGAACMSEIMITGEGEANVVRGGVVATSPGLGFVPEAIIDQHFIAQQRLGRLLSVVLEHPTLLGIGIDESTAVWVDPQRRLEVLGSGSVVVFDAGGTSVRSLQEEKPRLGVNDARLHVLLPGDRLDLRTRQLLPVSEPHPSSSRDRSPP
jgi:cyanophycinase